MRQRSAEEIMRNISTIYNSLSPENLYCDGEINESQARIKRANLYVILHQLFNEIGYEVSEDEAYNYSEKNKRF